MTDDPPKGKKADKPHHLKHRKRLRTRFLKDMGTHMEDYEILELLLCQTIPRRDVKPLAKSMIDTFGDLAGVLAAEPRSLAAVEGLGETSIVGLKLVQHAAVRMLRQDLEEAHVLSSWQAVLDYCRAAMGREKIEQFRLLFLDNRNRLMADEVQQQGTVDHTPLYPREVVKRALELNASALIMVHNHPSGDPTPSKADIAMTKAVRDALSKIDIKLHDHIIIAKSEVRSLRSDGFI